jgi:hypothetical protein
MVIISTFPIYLLIINKCKIATLLILLHPRKEMAHKGHSVGSLHSECDVSANHSASVSIQMEGFRPTLFALLICCVLAAQPLVDHSDEVKFSIRSLDSLPEVNAHVIPVFKFLLGHGLF